MRKFICPTCEGKKKITIREVFKQLVPCPDCKGDGVAELRLKEISVEDIVYEAERLFNPWMEQMEPFLYGREGIVLLVFNTKTGKFLYTLLGKLPNEKVAEKLFFATEKMKRLAVTGEVSSFESENISLSQFGGAIRLGDIILSASGFPPHMDQNFCINVAQQAEVCDEFSANIIYNLTEEKIRFWSRKMAEENQNK